MQKLKGTAFVCRLVVALRDDVVLEAIIAAIQLTLQSLAFAAFWHAQATTRMCFLKARVPFNVHARDTQELFQKMAICFLAAALKRQAALRRMKLAVEEDSESLIARTFLGHASKTPRCIMEGR
ncbi:hypothetical protein [Aporhodopirellula aestuarii]|uniref:Uncharacterized protein n=1 Tax=Aporhodopirellula aestuarii TaxID=2950107 RepID=A0ABT0UBN2_9BACT|nr:hypothetical protein [Aporhodopirellula aestuarii]MCM2374196.1 hypothetical protein [Aporhodopirellula aestuarii]